MRGESVISSDEGRPKSELAGSMSTRSCQATNAEPSPRHGRGRKPVGTEAEDIRVEEIGRDGRLVERRHREIAGELHRLAPLLAVVLGLDHQDRVGVEEVSPHQVDGAAARGPRRAGARVDGDERTLVLIVGLLNFRRVPGLAVVFGYGEVDLAAEIAVAVIAVEGAVAHVDAVRALVRTRRTHDVEGDVRFVEEVAVGGVIADLEHGRALILPGVAALLVVEVLKPRDDHLALFAAGEAHENGVDVAAGAGNRYRIGGRFETVDGRCHRSGGEVERRPGHEETAPGEATVVGTAAADPGFGGGHRRRLDDRQIRDRYETCHHEIEGVHEESEVLILFTQTLVVRDIDGTVVVEEGQ